MGWSMSIGADQPITDDDLAAVMPSMPGIMEGWKPSRQSWGWSAQVDVRIDDDGVLLSGAGYSRDLADGFSLMLKEALRRHGKTGLRQGRMSS